MKMKTNAELVENDWILNIFIVDIGHRLWTMLCPCEH